MFAGNHHPSPLSPTDSLAHSCPGGNAKILVQPPFSAENRARPRHIYSNAVQNRDVSKRQNLNSIRILLPPDNKRWEVEAARSIRANGMGLMRAEAIEQRENHGRESERPNRERRFKPHLAKDGMLASPF